MWELVLKMQTNKGKASQQFQPAILTFDSHQTAIIYPAVPASLHFFPAIPTILQFLLACNSWSCYSRQSGIRNPGIPANLQFFILQFQPTPNYSHSAFLASNSSHSRLSSLYFQPAHNSSYSAFLACNSSQPRKPANLLFFYAAIWTCVFWNSSLVLVTTEIAF